MNLNGKTTIKITNTITIIKLLFHKLKNIYVSIHIYVYIYLAQHLF